MSQLKPPARYLWSERFASFRHRNIEYLWDAIGEFRGGYSIQNDRVRRLYAALSGDDITKQQPLWRNFTAHVKLRGEIVHGGKNATRLKAEDSYVVVDALMNHVEGVLSGVRAR